MLELKSSFQTLAVALGSARRTCLRAPFRGRSHLNLCRSLAIEREFGCLALFVGLKFFATSRRVELSVVGCCWVRSRHEGTRASNLLRGFSGSAPVLFYPSSSIRKLK